MEENKGKEKTPNDVIKAIREARRKGNYPRGKMVSIDIIDGIKLDEDYNS